MVRQNCFTYEILDHDPQECHWCGRASFCLGGTSDPLRMPSSPLVPEAWSCTPGNSFCPPCHHSGTLCPCCLLYSNLWWLFLLPLLALALPQTMESCQEVYWVRFCPWLTFVLSFSSLKILLLDNFQIYAAESDFFPQPERSVSNCL